MNKAAKEEAKRRRTDGRQPPMYGKQRKQREDGQTVGGRQCTGSRGSKEKTDGQTAAANHSMCATTVKANAPNMQTARGSARAEGTPSLKEGRTKLHQAGPEHTGGRGRLW